LPEQKPRFSAYEFNNVKSVDFEFFRKGTFFTADSVLTAATMDVLLSEYDYTETYQEYGQLYPHRGYGGSFKSWIYSSDPKPYNNTVFRKNAGKVRECTLIHTNSDASSS
jgi:hypothetical protein